MRKSLLIGSLLATCALGLWAATSHVAAQGQQNVLVLSTAALAQWSIGRPATREAKNQNR
jgi:hypothetical protein